MMKKIVTRLFASLLTVTTAFAALTVPASAADGSWKKDSTGWWYSYSAGSYAKNGWEKIGGSWYYFDAQGYMKTGWVKDGGAWYYLSSSGAMKTGWVKDGTEWYFLSSSGAMKTGWVKSAGKWYYMNPQGKMLHDTLLPLSDGTYYLDRDGSMFAGELQLQDETLVFGDDGRLIEASEPGQSSEEQQPVQITFGTPRGWVTNGETDFYFLSRADMAVSLDSSNIMIFVTSTAEMSAEEKALISNPEAYVTDAEIQASLQAQIEAQTDLELKGVKVTGEVNKTTKGQAAATFLIDYTITVSGVDIPFKISQTHIFFEDTLVIVQLTTTEPLYETYRTDLNKVLTTLDIA